MKTPSRVSYDRDHWETLWGFEVGAGTQAFSWTKLLLDPVIDRDNFNDQVLEETSSLGIFKLPKDRDAQGVITDFLRKVHQHVWNMLRWQLFDTSLEYVPIQYWFAFPAVWSEVARSRLEQAARNAGFGSRNSDRVFTVSEPEAAALATFQLGEQFGLKASLDAWGRAFMFANRFYHLLS